MSLEQLNDSALAALMRHCQGEIPRRQEKLEHALGKQNVNEAYIVTGCLQELRHLVAAANSQLRARAKGVT
jgi:hypothetical protein